MTEKLLQRFRLFIIKIPRTNTIISLWPSFYISQNPQNTGSQTELKNYKQFRSVRNEALIWVKITTNTENKIKV